MRCQCFTRTIMDALHDRRSVFPPQCHLDNHNVEQDCQSSTYMVMELSCAGGCGRAVKVSRSSQKTNIRYIIDATCGRSTECKFHVIGMKAIVFDGRCRSFEQLEDIDIYTIYEVMAIEVSSYRCSSPLWAPVN